MVNKHYSEPKTSFEISRAEVLKILTLDEMLHKQMMFALLAISRRPWNIENESFELSYDGLADICNTENTEEFRKQVYELSKTKYFSFYEVTKRIPLPGKPLIVETVVFRVTFLTKEERESEDNQLTMDVDTTPEPDSDKKFIAHMYKEINNQ